MGSDVLVGELKSLGLTRFLGGSKLNQLGMMYAEAGVLLRFPQTSHITDDGFASTVAVVRERPDRPWRFADYPV
jgi:hypothetical protein